MRLGKVEGRVVLRNTNRKDSYVARVNGATFSDEAAIFATEGVDAVIRPFVNTHGKFMEFLVSSGSDAGAALVVEDVVDSIRAFRILRLAGLG